MNRNIIAPLSDEVAKELKSGDYVYITGTIYTARDAAHKRMWEALEKGEELPIEIEKQHNLLYGTITCKRRKTNRFSRTYELQAEWISMLQSFLT
ncbi:fumarate hydratase, class I [human gut metagenome]|uniref:Fumarate hydratase, class I n=1 Tax=human gut metagenome TaxID=408170 RepID=K1RGP5_9ZZZZ